MELRTLKYFLAVAREENITNAAEILHVTQPTLSRQMMDLEKELGKSLFVRSNRKTTLTEDGMHLRKRAEEIVSLVERTETEFQSTADSVYGDIHIGAGETEAMERVANAVKRLQTKYPLIKYHLHSGNADDVTDRLEHGLLDFGLLFEPVNKDKYDYISVPVTDRMGVLMRKDSPYAGLEFVTPDDLVKMPLLFSARQNHVRNFLVDWLKTDIDQLHVVAYYNLVYNASLMVKAGVGNALTIDGLVNTTGDSALCFVPLKPEISLHMVFVWKKYQMFSKATELFLAEIKQEFSV